MNGSKPYGPSGDQQTAEAPTRFAATITFPLTPAPRPSPSGRGRILRSLSAQPSVVSAGRTSGTTEPAAGCSLSLWERVRVRGIGLPFNTVTRTLPEIVELHDNFMKRILIPTVPSVAFTLSLLAATIALSAVAEEKESEAGRSEEHTSELQSPCNLVCRLLLEKKKNIVH